MSTSLTFLGGAGTVTGSKFLFDTGRSQVLVDCGPFQGLAPLRRRNRKPPVLDLDRLDAVVLTHAHLDHCGYLPVPARNGWRGPVHATQGTADLAAIVPADSAHLMVEDARQANEGGWTKHHPALPLYDPDDAQAAIRLFRPLDYGEPTRIARGVDLELGRAGTSSAPPGRTWTSATAAPSSAATWAARPTASCDRRSHARSATRCWSNRPTAAVRTTTNRQSCCWPTRSAEPSPAAAAC